MTGATQCHLLGGDALQEVQQQEAAQEAIGTRQQNPLWLSGQIDLPGRPIGPFQWWEVPGRKRVQVQVLCLNHVAAAAVDPLKGNGIWLTAPQQVLHLKQALQTA